MSIQPLPPYFFENKIGMLFPVLGPCEWVRTLLDPILHYFLTLRGTLCDALTLQGNIQTLFFNPVGKI